MTEAAPAPLAQDLAETTETGERAGADRAPSITFSDLVRVHLRRQSALEAAGGDDSAETEYQRLLDAFQRDHGRIVNAYWCSDIPSAVALTEKQRPWPLRWRGPELTFHRVTDWATKDRPRIAGALHDCDDLAIRASRVLRGSSLRICMQLVMSSASHLLSLVDTRAAHGSEEKTREALELQERELKKARAYYGTAAQGEAEIVYSAGMVAGAVAVGAAAALAAESIRWGGIDDRAFFGSLAAGAIGAVVSVIARITSSRFSLHYEVGKDDLLFLGFIRPLLGAIFGLVLYLAVLSGFVDVFKLPQSGTTKEFYFLLVIAFAAGFSERWAQDTLLGSKQPKDKKKPAGAGVSGPAA